MIDEQILAAVVSLLVSATADKLSETGRSLRSKLRRRTRDNERTATVLDRAQELPDTNALVSARAALALLAETTPEVADLLTQLGTRLPPPRQLPPAPSLWVDRTTELAAAVDTVRDGPQRLVVIIGLPGVGKSALALRAAHLCADLAPDGHLYLNLTGPLPTREALTRLLRSLRVPTDQIPPAVEEQAALWRSMTVRRRLLLMLADAASPEQVRPLLPASNDCLVLITTRNRLPGLAVDGAHTIHVAPLATPDAVDLLERIVDDGRVRQDLAAATDLVRVCGGLPLAVAITAATLTAQPHWPIRDLLHTNHDQEGAPSMAVAFDMAYQGLPPEAARCFRLLALHPGPDFGAKVAAAALATTAEQAVALLDQLAAAHLLEQPRPARWAYPQSVLEHATLLVRDDPDSQQAVERMIRWYLMLTLGAAQVLTPYLRRLPTLRQKLPTGLMPLTGRAAALRWLEQERRNLVAAVVAAAPWSPGLAYDLAYAMWPLFHYGRAHADRKLVDKVAVECARQLRDPRAEAEAIVRQAWGRYDLNHLDEAAELFAAALRTAEQHHDLYMTIAALAGLGHTKMRQADPAEAYDVFEHQIALAEQLGQPRAIAMALHNLGKASMATTWTRQAVEYLHGAVKMFTALGDIDPYNAALAAIDYGTALIASGQADEATEHLTDGLARMTELGSPRGQALAHRALAHIARAAGQTEVARSHLTAAYGLFHRCGDHEAAATLTELADIAGRS